MPRTGDRNTTLIDLPSALRLAGSQNPALAIAYQRTLAATAAQQLAAARLLPNLNGGTNFDGHSGVLQQASGNILNVHRDSLYVGAGSGAVAAGTVSIPGVQYNLNLSDSIFNYLSNRPAINRSRFLNQATSNDVQRDVALAYGELLRTEGVRAIDRQIRDDSAEVARVTADFARTGQGNPADAERAATELNRREALVVQADANVARASANLVELLNLQVAGRLQTAEPWVVPRSIVPDPIPLPELLATALYQRPELAAQRAAIDGAFIGLRAAKVLPFSPQIIAGYSAGSFGGGSNLVASATPPTGVEPNSPRFGDFAPRSDIDAIMYWSLLNMGIGNRAMIKGAQARLTAADFERLVVLNQVRAEVAEAFARKRTRLALLDVRRRAVETSQDAFEQDLARTRAAEGLPIEVLDSLRLLDRARIDYLNAIVDYNEAQFDLYWALGQPPANLLVRPVVEGGVEPINGAPGNGQR
jgi:outer membrane protein TolC